MDERAEVVDAPPVPRDTLDRGELVERLVAHRTLGGAPRHELEWLAAHGELRRYAPGELLANKGDVVDIMIVMLEGHGAVYIDRGSGKRKFMEWQAGDVTGLLPFSRLIRNIGEPRVDQATEALLLHRNDFPELIRECPAITASLVHTMLDRVRHFASTDWQDDKMVSLGRLAAGLGHELNNPASAASRSAQLLGASLSEADAAASAFAASSLTDDQRAHVTLLRASMTAAQPRTDRTPIECADREEEIASWLERHQIDVGIAGALADTPITLAMLDELATVLPRSAADAALRWISASHASRALAKDVERATSRIYDLVSAVKRFTYMDRPNVTEPLNIVQAIADTITVLGSKAKEKSVIVTVDVPGDLPRVPAYGGELNQVWSNLIENALDAVDVGGHVTVSARAAGETVVVRVIDDGTGIPPDMKSRIFDPFFTTKPVGQGTGLGLDITRRVVRRHDGQIEVESEPGKTEFRVMLPAEHATV
jgi:signal transduction histidine kinase